MPERLFIFIQMEFPWALGPPDHVLEMSAPYTVPARAGDVYRCFVVPTNFPEDRWVSRVEYAPGDRKAVHHVLAYFDTGSAAQALQRVQEPGAFGQRVTPRVGPQ